jgi:hypothetical protein
MRRGQAGAHAPGGRATPCDIAGSARLIRARVVDGCSGTGDVTWGRLLSQKRTYLQGHLHARDAIRNGRPASQARKRHLYVEVSHPRALHQPSADARVTTRVDVALLG